MLLKENFTLEGLKTNPEQYVGQDIEVYSQQQLDDYDLEQKLVSVTDKAPEGAEIRSVNVTKIRKPESLADNFDSAVRYAHLDGKVTEFKTTGNSSIFFVLTKGYPKIDF